MHDVVIVGAGAAGIGCGAMLRTLGLSKFVLLDREGIGASFERWPKEMRFITPSFTSNAFGMLDLNAVFPATSPAYTLQVEHPTGPEYAQYLRAVRDYCNLPVESGVDVQRLEAKNGRFRLHTSKGIIHSRFVIWATGEFQYPNLSPFPGAELCTHTSQVSSWKQFGSRSQLVIGGYESGADAAVHLSQQGAQVTLLDTGSPWEGKESDPSVALSPYTAERLARAKSIRRVSGFRVCQVKRHGDGYEVRSASGPFLKTTFRPLLATGFTGGLSLIGDMLDWTEDGDVVVTAEDESTRVPGLFVAGPQLRHNKIIFCFIYKFRQRFAVIGRAIARELDRSDEPLTKYRGAGMFLDDLRCCKEECRC